MPRWVLLEGGGYVGLEAGGQVLLEEQIQPALVMPNGRWRSVADESYIHYVPNITDLDPTINEIGFTIFFVSSSAASWDTSAWSLNLVAPSGEVSSVSHVFAGNDFIAGQAGLPHNYVSYTVQPGDLDEQGRWTVYLARRGIPVSGYGHFQVLGPVH